VRFPEGLTPDDFPGINFVQRQPDPATPGGSDPSVPPVPNDPGNTLIPFIDENEDLFFIELNDEDVPLGSWFYDDDEDVLFWIFDEDIPLGFLDLIDDMPETGSVPIHHYVMLLGFVLVGAGLVVLYIDRYRPIRCLIERK
jgi:hypothetical protein